MKEDLWDLWTAPADARCITTNGTVKTNGRAVMGRGVAKQATDRYQFLQLMLGMKIREFGNHVQIVLPAAGVSYSEPPLVSFPVKHEWGQLADLQLIERSAAELVILAGVHSWQTVVLPRPGCGNGGRSWEREVRPVIRPILDDRFLVVTL